MSCRYKVFDCKKLFLRIQNYSISANITPTVELNALAMKRGEPAIYKLLDPPHPQAYQPQPAYSYRRPYGVSIIILFGLRSDRKLVRNFSLFI